MKTEDKIKKRLASLKVEYDALWKRIDANDDAEDRGYRVNPDTSRELDAEQKLLGKRMDELKWVLND